MGEGINAARLCEASYTSIRLGLYEHIKVAFGAAKPDTTSLLKKFVTVSAAGAIGSLAGNLVDLLKTKMMASKTKGAPSIAKTASELFANQGIAGFYCGIDSNIARAMVLNGKKMGVSDQSKGYVVALTGLSKTSHVTQFLSRVTAGFFMTCTLSPFDMIHTHLMNQPSDAKLYNNTCDRMIKIAPQ